MGKVAKSAGVIVCLVISCTLLFTGCGPGANQKPTADLTVQGNIKTDETNINSKLAGLIETVFVEEGQEVGKGDVLLRLDSRSLAASKQQAQAALQAAREQQSAAAAALESAQAQYEKAVNGTRSQDLAQALAAYELAAKTYERIRELHGAGAVSNADLDQAATQYTVTQQAYTMALEGARTEDISIARAAVAQAAATVEAAAGQVLQAEGAVAEVDTYLEDTEITAPLDGRITALNVNAGELISTGMPLATISSTEKPWVELKVRETDLSFVSLNQSVQVNIAAYPDKVYQGTVVRINKKPDFATKRSTSNNGTFDVLSYGVKIVLTDLDEEVYPGMTVFVHFVS